MRVALEVLEHFPGGVSFVDLSPITDPRLVAHTISSAFRVRQESGLPVLDVLTEHLRDRVALMILDNFTGVGWGGDRCDHPSGSARRPGTPSQGGAYRGHARGAILPVDAGSLAPLSRHGMHGQ
jgi:hypothetical protein